MKTFVIHIVLSFLGSYLFFSNTSVPATTVYGTIVFGLFLMLLWLVSYFYQRWYFRKLPKGFSLLLYFLKDFIVANLRVAIDILSPGYNMKPTLVALPLDIRSDLEITMLSTMISLTPGTLSIDLSPDRRVLYMHALYIPDEGIEAFKQEIKSEYEQRIKQLLA
ncbi:Na+/H+ antiporter subunit E [Pontibacter burrus]|uniref:Cation:proton antiporter n=1 Tax=Pontibacter burrus TaxID=2704466 RepID=A0A6B3LYM9_9BACT|nr:Na+/H+ antiporter subunit E [Pontibacter burrus]NEM98740.1 cation:proton antiporter [Pontibacter burrus]